VSKAIGSNGTRARMLSSRTITSSLIESISARPATTSTSVTSDSHRDDTATVESSPAAKRTGDNGSACCPEWTVKGRRAACRR
jgi:hypothetical protein